MHCSYFPSRINVEETYEQCCLGYHNSKRLKGVSDGMGTQVGIQMINKCRVKMIRNELYNVEEPP